MRRFISFLVSAIFIAMPAAVYAQAVGAPSSTGPACLAISANLSYGSRDSAANNSVITALQNFLIRKGYLRVSVSGFFGNATQQAVKAFQLANNIASTGFVGPLTRQAIMQVNSCLQPNASGSNAPVSLEASSAMSNVAAVAFAATPSTATFGNTSIGGTANQMGTDKDASQVSLTQPGTLESISAYFSNSGFNAKAAIYTDNSGAPGTLVAQSASVAVSGSGWQTFTLPQTNLSVGTYWLSVDTDSATAKGAMSAASANQHAWKSTTFANEFTPSFGTPSGTEKTMTSIYATYMPVVVTPAPTVSISVSPTSIANGATTNVTWSSTNATACTISEASNSSWKSGTSGSSASDALTANTTFTASCTGAGGSASQSASVAVAAPVPTPTPTPTGPTFGNTIVGTTANQMGTDKDAGRFQLTQAGTIQSISAYFSNSGFNAKAAIYTDNSGAPGTLVAQSGSQSVNAVGWQTFAVPQTNLNAGYYWLSVDASAAMAKGALSTGATKQHAWKSTTYSSEFTSSFGTPSGTEAMTPSIYATYVPTTIVTPAPTVSISVSPTSIANGATTNVTWSSTNATACTISEASNSSWKSGTSGSSASDALTANTTFTASCTGAGGSASQSASVAVAAVVQSAPTVTISATPVSIAYNATTNVAWSSTNATACVINQGSTIWKSGISGSAVSNPLTANTTFTATCSGAGGTTTKNVIVTVGPAPVLPTVSISVSPTSIAYNATTNVLWSSTNATACTISEGSNSSWKSGTSGSSASDALTANTTFTATCTGAGGSASQNATVAVGAAPVATTTLRNKYVWPFSSTSIWNTPIGSGAVFVPANITGVPTGTTLDMDEEFIGVNPNDPVKTLSVSSPKSSFSVHVPPTMSHNGNQWNGCATLLNTDNNTVEEGQILSLTAGGNPSWTYGESNISLTGDGTLGCHGGSGLAGFGGTLMASDIGSSSPIHHVLKINLYGDKWLSNTSGGYRWPAVTSDTGYNTPSDTIDYYGGSVSALRMGSLLAIPRTAANISYIASIVSPDARKIAQAMMDYGAYVVDNTGYLGYSMPNQYGAPFENMSSQTFTPDASSFNSDITNILGHLQVVDNNSSTSVGGGGTYPANLLAPTGFSN